MSFLSYNILVQQYFIDEKLNIGMEILLPQDVLYHLIKVLRKDETYKFRICDSAGNIFYAHLIDRQRCLIEENTEENNELDCKITCILSLIKNDKLELCVQKLTELGVSRIVFYEARRSVVRLKEDRKVLRLSKIAREAAEQSHRNMIPEICSVNSLKELASYKSDVNYFCYEVESNIADIQKADSITYVIGPEGGFTDEEYRSFTDMGFESVSLGKRILRAETAAIYMTCIIAGKCQ